MCIQKIESNSTTHNRVKIITQIDITQHLGMASNKTWNKTKNSILFQFHLIPPSFYFPFLTTAI